MVYIVYQDEIANLEMKGTFSGIVDDIAIELGTEDFAISTADIPGWLVSTEGSITVALDITITESLREEGIAREMVNRIQNLRKDSGLEVTDRISLTILKHNEINSAINNNLNYICSETLADKLELTDDLKPEVGLVVEVEEGIETIIKIEKTI